ncbi:MAG: HAMP domain-containing histidine kinase [Lysobacter sp.]|nr:HAMP domain-containing histidine kinase [Lysobacter sp.]
MTVRISLRRRVTLAYTVLGLVLSLLFAAATVFITEDYEHILVDEILRGQADDYALRLAANPATVLPQSHRLSGYLRRIDGHGNVPAGLAALDPGIHERGGDSAEGIHVGVFDTDQGRLYFVIDLSDIERLESHLEWFLTGVIVLGTGVAGWLGWLLAGGTVAPVRRLAEAVDALTTRPQASALADTVSDDELGRLAASIDRYQARLVDTDAQERRFFADASHELRTPIAVVRGAAELLLEEQRLPERTRGVLQRMDRGVRELTDLLDVVLDLARRRELDFEWVDANALLREAAASLQEAGSNSSLDIRIDASGQWRVSRRESLLVLRGVLRHLLPPDCRGILSLRGEHHVLDMSYVAADGASLPRLRSTALRSDSGLALTLLGRLAAALEWELDDEVSPDTTSRRVRIRLPHSALPN